MAVSKACVNAHLFIYFLRMLRQILMGALDCVEKMQNQIDKAMREAGVEIPCRRSKERRNNERRKKDE